MRDYITHYINIFKSLQNKKIELLRYESIVKNAQRVYFFKTRVQNFIKKKLVFFRFFQQLLFQSSFLIYVNIKRQLFINFDVNKKFDIEVMLYYVKKVFFQNFKFDIFSSRHAIESILFFNRFITLIEFKY